MAAVGGYLDQRRLLTTRVQIDEPYYQGLMVVAEVLAMAGIRAESIQEDAVTALYEFINPVTGGLDGTGWPFGQTLNDGDINALLRGVPGVATVGRVYFFLADLRTGDVRDQQLQRVALPPDALLMSYGHQVQVDAVTGWLLAQLPRAMNGNPLVQAFVDAAEHTGDSVRAQLDALEYQLDPDLASPEMLAYLAGWLGFPLDSAGRSGHSTGRCSAPSAGCCAPWHQAGRWPSCWPSSPEGRSGRSTAAGSLVPARMSRAENLTVRVELSRIGPVSPERLLPSSSANCRSGPGWN